MPCVIPVRVTPRSANPGIGVWRAGADGREELEVRVAAAPTDGKANADVIALLAKRLNVSKSSIRIISGETSRHKRLSVSGEEEDVRRLLT